MELNIGKNIRRLRAERNVTQDELAELLGVSGQSVSRWENGVCYPDLELLPSVASYFGVTVDTLLGVDIDQREQKIREYLELFELMRLKDYTAGCAAFEEAVKEFPGEHRLLVRYMELLSAEKDHVRDPGYENTSRTIRSIYERIQAHCTDDSVRMWAKRLMCQHLVRRYECAGDESARAEADELIDSMPAMENSRGFLKMRLSSDAGSHRENGRLATEETLYLLNGVLAHTVYYEPDLPPARRSEITAAFNELLLLLLPDAIESKLGIFLIYNLGHMGHWSYESGDEEAALKYLKESAEAAVLFDKQGNAGEVTARFYEQEPVFRDMDMRARMKKLFTEKYPLSDSFKERAEFKEILAMLEDRT